MPRRTLRPPTVNTSRRACANGQRHLRHSAYLVILVAGVCAGLALPSAAHAASNPEPIPGFVQTLEKRPGWALCYVKDTPMKAFYCPVYPKGSNLAVQMGWYDVAKCAAGIGLFIAGNVVAALKIKKAGGVWKAARKIFRKEHGETSAERRERVTEAVYAIFGELTGVTAVITACGG